MNFSIVKEIIIPEGIVTKITSGTQVLWQKVINVVNYTNQIPISTDESGNVFNGTGFMTSKYMNQGTVNENSTTCVTGFIPCVKGDVLRMKNMSFNTTVAQCRLTFFDVNKTYISQALVGSSWYMDTKFTGIKDDDGNYVCLTLADVSGMTTNMAYIRITAIDITEDSIVTINEPIE